MALLVLAPWRVSRVGLVDALTAHYGSPGQLADYRRQFEKTTRSAGEDPSIFATALETLAINAFGDMGQSARLRLIQDLFIAGHNSCELRRHLDSVSPETPIRDIVDRCRVWESHADSDVRRVSKPGADLVFPTYVVSGPDRGVDDLQVAAVTTPKSTPDQVEDFFSSVAGECGCTGSNTETRAPCGRPVASTSGGGNLGSAACAGSGDRIGGVGNFA